MSLLHLRIIAKDPEHHVRNWERLSRALMLKLAAELRHAKSQVRNYKRRLKQAEINQDTLLSRSLRVLLAEAIGIERELNNVFQGAKEWWNLLSPEVKEHQP